MGADILYKDASTNHPAFLGRLFRDFRVFRSLSIAEQLRRGSFVFSQRRRTGCIGGQNVKLFLCTWLRGHAKWSLVPHRLADSSKQDCAVKQEDVRHAMSGGSEPCPLIQPGIISPISKVLKNDIRQPGGNALDVRPVPPLRNEVLVLVQPRFRQVERQRLRQLDL